MARGNKADKISALVFMLLAIAAVVRYFIISDKAVFLYCGGTAIVLRLVQHVLRYIH